MLKILPKYSFPITRQSINPLMDGVVQLNLKEAHLTEQHQKAIGIYLHVFDLWVKSKGALDYRGREGHERLKQDAANFCVSNHLMQHQGDISAAHLAIDWHDTAVRATQVGQPLPPNNTSDLMVESVDLFGLNSHDEKRIGLWMDWCSKKAI